MTFILKKDTIFKENAKKKKKIVRLKKIAQKSEVCSEHNLASFVCSLIQ